MLDRLDRKLASSTQPSLCPALPSPCPSPRPHSDPFSGGRLQRVRCQLKTTGGDCRELVRESLGALLRRMGLNPLFFYDGSQFRPRALPRAPPRVLSKPPSQQLRPGGEPTVAEVEAVRARAAAAGFPSQTISEEQFKAMEAQSVSGMS